MGNVFIRVNSKETMENKMKDKLQKETTVTLQFNLLQKLVDQMYWDWDRLSRSGQDTLDKIANIVGVEEIDLMIPKNESWKKD